MNTANWQGHHIDGGVLRLRRNRHQENRSSLDAISTWGDDGLPLVNPEGFLLFPSYNPCDIQSLTFYVRRCGHSQGLRVARLPKVLRN